METKAILIRGQFDDADWRELLAVVRRVERRHQDRDYHVLSINPDADLLKVAQDLLDSYPMVEGKEPWVAVIPRDDARREHADDEAKYERDESSGRTLRGDK